MNGESLEHDSHRKEFEKTRKKLLTNPKRCVNIKQFAAVARATAKSELTVPCKLNNVKTNYNTLDIFKCLSLESCKRILSQRKFLSIFAKTNLFKNLI